jgi:hypothetical protein
VDVEWLSHGLNTLMMEFGMAIISNVQYRRSCGMRLGTSGYDVCFLKIFSYLHCQEFSKVPSEVAWIRFSFRGAMSFQIARKDETDGFFLISIVQSFGLMSLPTNVDSFHMSQP